MQVRIAKEGGNKINWLSSPDVTGTPSFKKKLLGRFLPSNADPKSWLVEYHLDGSRLSHAD